jgi:hypothetical protein
MLGVVLPYHQKHHLLKIGRQGLMEETSSASQNLRSVDDILTEQELLDLLGIKKSALLALRQNKRLPFCKVTNTARIYLVKDVLDFLVSKRTVLNKQA